MKIFYYLDQVKQYLECYGIYYICYPICGLICLAGILSPILNEYLLFLCLCGSHDPQATPNPLYRSRYQGFCWFPYISEVSKEGFLYYPFLIGTSISIIPWIVSMFHYMKLNLQVFYLHVDNYFLRLIFRLMEHVRSSWRAVIRRSSLCFKSRPACVCSWPLYLTSTPIQIFMRMYVVFKNLML